MKRDTPDYTIQIAKELRKEQTEAESILWKFLKSRKLKGFKFRIQYPIGRYIADFYCIEKRLIIEIDGEIHNRAERKEYDLIRNKEIECRNIKILRFTNQEVFNNVRKVIEKTESELAPLPSSGEGLGVRVESPKS